MAENLLSQKYDVPPAEAYKLGPYLHSIGKNFIGNDYNIPKLDEARYLNRLKEHLRIALIRE